MTGLRMLARHRGANDVNHGIVIGNVPYFDGDSAAIVEHAVAAEEAGWDGVFMGDHLCYSPDDQPQAEFDPWITLAGIATQTDELTLGTWVTTLPRRQPWQVARNLATLDRLSDGRVMLGTGLGVEDFYTPFGQSWEPKVLGEKYDEALDVITGLWSGDPFSYDGDHFSIDEVVMRPTPVREPRIPIVTGCWWPNKKPFARGADYDGIMPNWPSLFGRGDYGTKEGSGTPVEELREMMEFYHGLTDAPGEIVLPIDPVGGSEAYVETAKQLGATWLLTTHADAVYSSDDLQRDMADFSLEEQIRQGPPE